MNWNRITLDGRVYVVMDTCRTERQAVRKAQKLGCRLTHVPGRGYLVLAPTDEMGLPVQTRGSTR